MRAYVGVTDRDWYRFLLGRPDLDEVNFWKPSGRGSFRALQPGEPFLFKLHYPEHAIVGGGTFLASTSFPLSITWEAFEEKNGTATMAEMRARITQYRTPRPAPNEDPSVGCIILEYPWFLPEPDWIQPPPDWQRHTQQARAMTSARASARGCGSRYLWRARWRGPARASSPRRRCTATPYWSASAWARGRF